MIKVIYCIIPIFNDWESFEVLYEKLNFIQNEIKNEGFKIRIIVVNDCSDFVTNFVLSENNIEIEYVNLKINIGHQRAIAVGLQYVYEEKKDCDFVVVMDGDGEDKPEDIKMLIEKAKEIEFTKIVFAQRKKRHEGILFKIGYFFYKKLFYFLTGQKINFGNFSFIPKCLLERVVNQNNIWNHFSGAIIQSKIPYTKITLDRGKRYKGYSKMNSNSLILHGLSSISVYFDYITLKILKISIFMILICSILVGYILYEKIFTDNAIPGWASSLSLIVLGIIVQFFTVTLMVLLLQLSSRKNILIPNSKIYKSFIQ